MSKKHGWLVFVTLVALLPVAAAFLVACGPEMATPTGGPPATNTVVAGSGEGEATTAPSIPTGIPSLGDLPVDANDWHVLGSPDAAVTMIEYSDFQ